jgi:adenylate cyclase
MNAQSGSSNARTPNTEIERKFLVREMPDLEAAKGKAVNQGYLAVHRDGTEVRLRSIGDMHFETVKTGSGLLRGEFEITITGEQFETLWPATEGRRLEKTRYELEYQHHTIHLDVYHGVLSGLKVAEVEFDSEADSRTFVPPPWFDLEITDESVYKNRILAMEGMPAS